MRNRKNIYNKKYIMRQNISFNKQKPIKKFSNKEMPLINIYKRSLISNESLRRIKSLNINKIISAKKKDLFSFYYFFFDFILNKLKNPDKCICFPKAYFIVYNFMCKIYDISSHILFFKQFNLLNATLKKMHEQKDFYPIYSFKKVNINDKDTIERLNKDLKKENSIFFLKTNNYI